MNSGVVEAVAVVIPTVCFCNTFFLFSKLNFDFSSRCLRKSWADNILDGKLFAVWVGWMFAVEVGT